MILDKKNESQTVIILHTQQKTPTNFSSSQTFYTQGI